MDNPIGRVQTSEALKIDSVKISTAEFLHWLPFSIILYSSTMLQLII